MPIPLNILTSKLSVYVVNVAPDAGGGAGRTPGAARLTSVPCRIAPASSGEVATFSRRDMVVTDKVYTAQDIALKISERLLVDGTAYLVASYQFTKTPDGMTGLGTAFVSKRN